MATGERSKLRTVRPWRLLIIHNASDNMKKNLILFLFLFVWVTGAWSQDLAVADFSLDETDLTANLDGTTKYDQNGEKCALIKIFTTATGLTFDVGSLGVVDIIQKPGEIWLYVPHGVRRVTINHSQLGMCDYTFPTSIVKARTYRMRLVAGQVQTTVRKAVTSQYVIFKVSPLKGSVEINGQMFDVVDGGASVRLPFGTYDYTVRAPRYNPMSGKVTVNDPQNKHTVSVSLEPAFASVTMSVDADAEIWINDQKRGTRTFTGELSYGTYLVECRQQGHRSSQQEITLTKENAGQQISLPKPTPIYGSIDINSTPIEADIYIDDKKIGVSPMFVQDYLIGTHRVRLSKAGHSDFSQVITVEEGQTFEVNAKLESGREVAISTAPGTEIFVDGKSVGNTQYTGNLTFGSHTAYAMLNGKRSGEKKIDIVVGNDKINIPLTFSDNLTFTVGEVSFTMIYVEGGTFIMGAANEQGRDAYENEKTAHSVTLDDYYIGQTEVTQALWLTVMGSNPSRYEGIDRPVECVNLDDCHKFVQKLNSITGKIFRLPTEAEWEYAARGGCKSRGYKYSGGNNIGRVAWYNNNSGSGTHSVATKSPNELGLYDMSGNVWELCSNSHSRGGSWGSVAGPCLVSPRDVNHPANNFGSFGFRLAMSE